MLIKTRVLSLLALSSAMALASPALSPDGLKVEGKAAEPNRAMKAFPPAEEGMKRFVVNLPKLEEEQAFKVEIIVGKTAEVDIANRHFLVGKLEEVDHD